jgi:hypothetical protein
MSRIAVIVALCIAVLLVAAAMLLNRQAAPSAPQGPLLDFHPAALVEIAVLRPGEAREVARRQPSGSWVIQLGEGPPWPAAGERIRPAIRILSTLMPQQELRGAGSVGEDATEVRLRLEDGSESVMRIARRALAGAVLVEVSSGKQARTVKGWVDASLGNMFTGTGLGPWRQPTALGEFGPEIARIRVQGTQGTVSLGRVQGRWALREPIAQPAEDASLARLLTHLGRVQVEDFLDQGPPAPHQTGLDGPVAVLTIERDVRDPREPGKIVTSRRMLEVGHTADVAGRTVFARLSGQDFTGAEPGAMWSRTVIVAGEELAAISTDPLYYIGHAALSVPPSEVGQVWIGAGESEGVRTGFVRTLDGWQRVDPVREPRPLGVGDGPGLTALLNLLRSSPSGIRLEAMPDAVQIEAVELQTLGGDPLDRFEIAAAGETLVAGSNGVWRSYTGEPAQGVLAWLGKIGSP